jgi:hypothetical protein
VRRRVARVESLAGDDEEAHAEEDDLYLSVLLAIAAGDVANPRGLAAEAVRTKKIKFARWYA